MPTVRVQTDESLIKKRLVDEISGPTGPVGPGGAVGPTGTTGPAGVTGSQGETGVQGITGQAGEQGEAGSQGETGVQGITGQAGEQGEAGSQGETGVQGITGQAGEQGEVGSQGETGVQGITGQAGEQGEVGSQGVTGITGSDGVEGAVGSTGAQGTTGVQGNTGEQGDPGITGVQGATGVQGNTGEQGDPGITGVQGTTGVQGVTGSQGDTGVQGATGVQGITGIKGVTGSQGDTGVQGTTGVQGITGIKGVTGSQGDTGIKGVTGDDGAPGAQGPTGVTGLLGVSLTHSVSIDAGGYFQIGAGVKDDTLSGINIDNTEIVGQASGVDKFRIGTDGVVTVKGGGLSVIAGGDISLAASTAAANPGKLILNGASVDVEVYQSDVANQVNIVPTVDGLALFNVGWQSKKMRRVRMEANYYDFEAYNASLADWAGISIYAVTPGGAFVSLGANDQRTHKLQLIPAGTTGAKGAFRPDVNNDMDLGTASNKFSKGFFNATVTTGDLSVTGDINFSGSIVAASWSPTAYNTTAVSAFSNGFLGYFSSDKKLKKDITYIKEGLEVVRKLKPANFTLRANEFRTSGFIAQDIYDVIPEAAEKMPDGYHAFNINPVVAYVAKSVQQLDQKLDNTATLIRQTMERIEKLEKENL